MKSKGILLSILFGILFILTLFVACNQQNIVNPIEPVPDIETLSARLDLEIAGLSNLPGDTAPSTFQLINGELGEITYTGQDNTRRYEFTYRIKRGSEKIDGIYIEYPDARTITIHGVPVTLRAEGALSHIANWEVDGVSYALYAHEGVPDALMADLLDAPLKS